MQSCVQDHSKCNYSKNWSTQLLTATKNISIWPSYQQVSQNTPVHLSILAKSRLVLTSDLSKLPWARHCFESVLLAGLAWMSVASPIPIHLADTARSRTVACQWSCLTEDELCRPPSVCKEEHRQGMCQSTRHGGKRTRWAIVRRDRLLLTPMGRSKLPWNLLSYLHIFI